MKRLNLCFITMFSCALFSILFFWVINLQAQTHSDSISTNPNLDNTVLRTRFYDRNTRELKNIERRFIKGSIVKGKPLLNQQKKDFIKKQSFKTSYFYEAAVHVKSKPAINWVMNPARSANINDILRLAKDLELCSISDNNPISLLNEVIRNAHKFYIQEKILPLIVVDIDFERIANLPENPNSLNRNGELVYNKNIKIRQERLFVVAPIVDEIGYKDAKIIVDKRFIITNRKIDDNFGYSVNGNAYKYLPIGKSFAYHFKTANQSTNFQISLDKSQSAAFNIRTTLVPAFDLTWEPCTKVSSEGESASIKPYVFFRMNHDTSVSAPEIQRPFVILGGMNQDIFGDYAQMYSTIASLSENINLIELLRNEFDVILLTYSNVFAPIQLNAEALACTIRDINNKNQNQDGIVFIGISMGGIVSNLTFTGMENSKIPGINVSHNVSAWVTIDSPHQGAHIPIGIQYMVDYFSWLPVAEIGIQKDSLDSPPSKELLIEHYSTNGNITDERKELLSLFEQWGGFPNRIDTKIAISSGALSATARFWQVPFMQIPHRCDPDLQCVSVPEEYDLYIPNFQNAIEQVKTDEGSSYFPVNNLEGREGIPLIVLDLNIDVFGISGKLKVWTMTRTIKHWGYYYMNPEKIPKSNVFWYEYAFDIVPNEVELVTGGAISDPEGDYSKALRPGIPLSTVVGGWIDTPLKIYRSSESTEFGNLIPHYPPLPRHCFIPLWSALDLGKDYLDAWYLYLTRFGPEFLVWESWFGSNYLGGRAIDRGYFSYEDFDDYDNLLMPLNRLSFNGAVKNETLYSGARVEDPVTGLVNVPTVTVRASKFDWIFFNSANRRHGEIDQTVLSRVLNIINEKMFGSSTIPSTNSNDDPLRNTPITTWTLPQSMQ